MNLEDIHDAEAVFVDSSILIYAAQGQSRQCRHLFARIDDHGVRGVCTTAVLAEVCHRSMLTEARSKELILGSNPARALSQRREAISHLTEYAEIVRDILNTEIGVESILAQDFHVALELQQRYGLLTNDSLNLAVARCLGLEALATTDTHFDGVPGIVVYRPDDLLV